jgi:hypothetical protein
MVSSSPHIGLGKVEIMSGLANQLPAVRVIGAVAVRAVVVVLAMIMLLVLLTTWTPQLVDPLLLRLGL